MALRKNTPQTRGVMPQRRVPGNTSVWAPTFVAIWVWGGSSCEKTSCSKTAYCISNDLLTQLALLTVVNNELGKPNAWVLTNLCVAVRNCIDQEFVQDLIWDAIEWYDYNDAINQWIQENPLSTASNISYDNSTSWLTATNVQDAIDELVLDTNISLYEAWTDDWIRYTKPNGSVIDLKTWHTEIVGHTANVPFTITHNLGSTRIHVVAYDVTSWEEVKVEVLNRTANTVDIVSTTSDQLEVVIKR